MEAITTIGLDIAKSVFQVHGIDAAGNVVVRRQLKRRYVAARRRAARRRWRVHQPHARETSNDARGKDVAFRQAQRNA